VEIALINPLKVIGHVLVRQITAEEYAMSFPIRVSELIQRAFIFPLPDEV
jgi:hypothetical protein